MSEISTIAVLASMLQAAGATAHVSPRRLARSTIHDLQYRVLIVGMAFKLHAEPDRYSEGLPRLQTRRLKLIQFVAIRPWLVETIEQWSANAKTAQKSFSTEEDLRRGFIGDTVHENVIELLLASKALYQSDRFLLPGDRYSNIIDMHRDICQHGLFVREQEAIKSLKEIKITNAMLEGW